MTSIEWADIYLRTPLEKAIFNLGCMYGGLECGEALSSDLRGHPSIEEAADSLAEAVDQYVRPMTMRAALMVTEQIEVAEMLEDALKALPRGISTGPEEEGRGDASTLQYSTAEPW